jgi:hypothetical protein
MILVTSRGGEDWYKYVSLFGPRYFYPPISTADTITYWRGDSGMTRGLEEGPCILFVGSMEIE